jgi:hypothetical protein
VTQAGFVFCENPECALHVSVTDPQVQGSGEWAECPDGLIFSRVWVGERLLCDWCARFGPHPDSDERVSYRAVRAETPVTDLDAAATDQ